MTLHQRWDSSGRTRFLLALTLSTVTAVAVAAPLAIQAIRADEVKVAGTPDRPATGEQESDDDSIDRTLTDDGGDAKGGIGSREPAKAVGQTSKSETQSPRPAAPTATENDVLTNPAPTEADVIDPPETEEPAPPIDPEPTTTTSTTTVAPTSSTTSTTAPDPSITSSSTTAPDPSTTSSSTTSTSAVSNPSSTTSSSTG